MSTFRIFPSDSDGRSLVLGGADGDGTGIAFDTALEMAAYVEAHCGEKLHGYDVDGDIWTTAPVAYYKILNAGQRDGMIAAVEGKAFFF